MRQLVGHVYWPDGSRSAYFRPLGPGVYRISVAPDASADSTPSGGDSLPSIRFPQQDHVEGLEGARAEMTEAFTAFLRSSMEEAVAADVLFLSLADKGESRLFFVLVDF